MACQTQQVWVLWKVGISIYSVSTYGSCWIINLVTIKEVGSLGVNDKALFEDSRSIKVWFFLRFKVLDLRALNRMVYWEKDLETLKTWKVWPKKLSIEELVDWKSIKACKTKPKYKKNK